MIMLSAYIALLLWTNVSAFLPKTCQKIARISNLKMGIFDSLKKIVGAGNPQEILVQENSKVLQRYLEKVKEINAFEDAYEKLSNEQLRLKTDEFRARIQKASKGNNLVGTVSKTILDSLLPEAFAVVREASWRVLKMRHFDVQLMGGIALYENRLAEMATGEGKTLVAILPVYLNALSGESAYVVTTNDYLAARDGEVMGQVFRYLGMSVGIVQAYQTEAERKDAYECDVTYVANQELGFDFLRDNLAMSLESVVQVRPYNFCVVDEADSILIDEARTPLIISRKGKSVTDKYVTCAQIAKELQINKHYEVDTKNQKVELTPTGFKFVEQIVGKSLFDLKDPWAYYVINGLKAKELYRKDQEYIINPTTKTVNIIDSFTGRILEGRRFTDGLQQSIEAKENLRVSEETQITAKVTYQNLFRLFPKLSGMTGTAFTEALEFDDVYQLQVLPIPTALPVARRDNDDAVFRTQNGKLKALLRNVLSTHEKGRPILIGTTSVEDSEEMYEALLNLNISANILNARPENIEKESDVIAQAGRLGAVTVSTNMAGRGTDILLGGSSKGVAKVLAKYLMFYHLKLIPSFDRQSMMDNNQYNEIQNELKLLETDADVLALPPIAAFIDNLNIWVPKDLTISTELELKRAIISACDVLTDQATKIDRKVTKLDVETIISKSVEAIPTTEFEIKLLRSILSELIQEFNEIIDIEREQVKRLGGLYVIGTARHESRRIDNQLRGRSGRQGDPGGTRFFLSLEDSMFKTFGADKMSGMMENFRVAEDMPIESDLVNQALDKVQQQVEAFFQANRQQVFKLDEVTSSQRVAIYSQRRAYLTSSDEGLKDSFIKFCTITLEEIVDAAYLAPTTTTGSASSSSSKVKQLDASKVVTKLKQFFPNIVLATEDINTSLSPTDIKSMLRTRLMGAISEKQAQIDKPGSPWSFASFFRYMTLVQIDESWCKHLSRLDLLKEEMVLQSFTAERDVMDIYRDRALNIFETLMDDVRRNTVYSVFIYKG